MRNRSKLLVAAFAATALLAMAVGSASANRLELRNSANGFKIVWNPLNLRAGSTRVECPVTLEGTFEASTYVKRIGTRIGAVTGAAVNNAGCTGGRATVLTGRLPWAVTYNGYEGPLPSITGVKMDLIEAEFNVESGGISCLARTTTARPGVGIARVTGGSGGTITQFTAESGARIETSGGFFCNFSGEASFEGTGTASARSSTAAITIRLI